MRVQGSEIRVIGSRCGVWGLRFGVLGFGFRDWGLTLKRRGMEDILKRSQGLGLGVRHRSEKL